MGVEFCDFNGDCCGGVTETGCGAHALTQKIVHGLRGTSVSSTSMLDIAFNRDKSFSMTCTAVVS
jgi:hypothetical protein